MLEILGSQTSSNRVFTIWILRWWRGTVNVTVPQCEVVSMTYVASTIIAVIIRVGGVYYTIHDRCWGYHYLMMSKRTIHALPFLETYFLCKGCKLRLGWCRWNSWNPDSIELQSNGKMFVSLQKKSFYHKSLIYGIQDADLLRFDNDPISEGTVPVSWFFPRWSSTVWNSGMKRKNHKEHIISYLSATYHA